MTWICRNEITIEYFDYKYYLHYLVVIIRSYGRFHIASHSPLLNTIAS